MNIINLLMSSFSTAAFEGIRSFLAAKLDLSMHVAFFLIP